MEVLELLTSDGTLPASQPSGYTGIPEFSNNTYAVYLMECSLTCLTTL